MRFALLALVGLLCLAGDAHARRVRFVAPRAAFVAPGHCAPAQFRAPAVVQFRAPVHAPAPVIAVPDGHGGTQFFFAR